MTTRGRGHDGMTDDAADAIGTRFPMSLVVQALATISDGSLLTDSHRNVVYVNSAFTNITGYAEEDVLGTNCRFLQGADTDPETVASIGHALTQGETFTGTILNYRRNGQPFWNALTIMPLRNTRGRITHYASVQREVTPQVDQRHTRDLPQETKRQAETDHLLLEAARLLGERSSASAVAQTVADVAPALCGADRAAVALWDIKDGRLFIAAVSGWEGHLADTIRTFHAMPNDSPELAQIVSSQNPVLIDGHGSDWARDVMSRYQAHALVATPVFSGGELRGLVLTSWSGRNPPDVIDDTLRERLTGLAGMAAVALDNTRLLEEVRWTESHDALTGLPNRILLEEGVASALEQARDTGSHVAILSCNIDRLKRVNDVLGHGAGDAVLCHVAAKLNLAARDGDTVSRTGGNDFAILLPNVSGLAETEAVTARLLKSLDEALPLGGRELFVHVSSGVAITSAEPSARDVPYREAAEQLVTTAGANMNRARTRKFSNTAPFGSVDELRLDSELHGALGRGELAAYYQPQIDVRSGRIVAVEALVRWHHPELGAIPPDAFIPIAEENGLIHEIGAFVLEEACDLAARWQVRGRPLEVAVNVSPLQLTSTEFFSSLVAGIRRKSLAAGALTIEITESRMVADIGVVAPQLDRLRALGIGISVDDFGTGYSSLSQLHTLPVSELKIDQTFIRADAATSAALVAAVVGLSRGLRLRVVAEGVETEEQLAMLHDLGCDRAQGYLIGKPMPSAELEALLGA